MEAFANYKRDDRPWGFFERFTLNEPSTVKIIEVNPDQEISLQQHAHRDEEWKILRGSGTVTMGDIHKDITAGDTVAIARGMKHRIKGGPAGIQFLEISLGDFDEKDIIRFQDDYGRN
ncbi:MAG TPA: phosphomannose isomerase type II C-terminal cupin domain [Candidatus Paceibacterota bacterium]|nr:phosphomannose isomerase type II C-terminal cupin domain [Candidatus Paceibacterota bacterium]